MPYMPGPTTPAPVVVTDATRAAVARVKRASPAKRAQLGRSPDSDYSQPTLGRYPTPDYDDEDARAFGYLGADELGFSFNPLKIVSNVAKAVTKGVSDTVNEARRAASNPLVQAAAGFVPGGGLITKGIGLASSIGGSRVAKIATNVNALTSGATSVNEVAARARAGIGSQAVAAANAQAEANRVEAARLEAMRVAAEQKAAEGERIQAANAAKAAADAAARAEKQRVAREKKAAEGARIQAENAAKAEAAAAEKKKQQAARQKIKEAAAQAKELQDKATAAAAAGDAAQAAALRAQADAATQGARAVSIGSGVASSDQMNAGGSSFAVAAPAEAPTFNKTALAVAGAAAVGIGLLAVTRGGGGGRSWH